MSDTLPIVVRQLADALDDPARARLLLAAPDHLVVLYASQMQDICRAAKFLTGDRFLSVRLAALAAVRDEDGLLPEHVSDDLAGWRLSMAAFARAFAADHGTTPPPSPSATPPPASRVADGREIAAAVEERPSSTPIGGRGGREAAGVGGGIE